MSSGYMAAASAEGFDGAHDAGEYIKSATPGMSEGRCLTDQDDDQPAFIARYEGGNYIEQRDRGEELYNEKVAMMDADGDGIISLEERAKIDGKAKSCIWEKAVPPKPDHKNSVGGIITGYKGHVPRARDKIGSNPLGGLPGTPVSPNGYSKTAESFAQGSGAAGTEVNNYATESSDPQGVKSAPTKPRLPNLGHVRPGFAGHVPGQKDIIGRSTFQTEDSDNYLAQKGTSVDQW